MTVRATTASGATDPSDDRDANSSSAALISFGACPSIDRTSNPAASSFAAIFSGDCCSLTRPVCPIPLQLKIGSTAVRPRSTMWSSASAICPSRDSPSPIRQ